jgi:SAM-dependent methyltransferase
MSQEPAGNRDERVVAGFGAEWSRFDQTDLPADEAQRLFDAYFDAFPWSALPANAVGADVGCGSGRWARLAAPRVGELHCVDASPDALAVARRTLAGVPSARFHVASVDELPFPDASLDFAYSLGVLHHVPDTRAAMRACVRKLKPGAPFLCYLYFRFDNRPAWYRWLWSASEPVRFAVSRSPNWLRHLLADGIAACVYWPLARLAAVAEVAGARVDSWPLSFYRHRPYYVLRTDALDRFGTRLEQRFTRAEIAAMAEEAGLEALRFNEHAPYWCFVARRKPADAR